MVLPVSSGYTDPWYVFSKANGHPNHAFVVVCEAGVPWQAKCRNNRPTRGRNAGGSFGEPNLRRV